MTLPSTGTMQSDWGGHASRVPRSRPGDACWRPRVGKRIGAIFGSEGLFCFDLNGELLWKKDLGPMDSGYFDVPSAQWGFASSPVLHDDKVVVLCDVQTNSFVAVFDAKDGRELWRTDRKDVPTWGTPTIISASGMAEAGRIRHHLKNHIGRSDNLILFIGYCAEHTLGAQILLGRNPVNIFGEPTKSARASRPSMRSAATLTRRS